MSFIYNSKYVPEELEMLHKGILWKIFFINRWLYFGTPYFFLSVAKPCSDCFLIQLLNHLTINNPKLYFLLVIIPVIEAIDGNATTS